MAHRIADLRWTALAVVLTLFFSHAVLATAAPHRARRVLVLYSERKGNPIVDAIDRGFQSTLRARTADSIDPYTEYLDLARFGNSRLQREQFEWFLSRYSHTRPDLIICFGSSLLAPLLRAENRQFAGVPILCATAGARQLPAGAPNPRVTGILNPLDARRTVEAALQLQPETRRVVVVGGASLNDRRATAGVREDLAAFRSRLEVSYLTSLSMAELERQLAALPSHTIVLYVSMLRDGAGQQFDSINVLSRLSRISSAPIYGMFDTALGYGIVGGSLISFELVGTRMGELAQRVLAGEKPASIPFEPRSGALAFDARQLRRWRLSEARLPPGAELRFREPTVWERYRWQIIGALLLILVESVLLAAVLVHRLRRRRAEAELRASYQQVQDLAGRLITAQETERSHLARELHDNFNQQLAALAIAHSSLKRRLPPGRSDLQEEVNRLQQQAVALSDAIRDLSHELHPGVLQHVGLFAALRVHCEQFSRDKELEVSFQGMGDLQDIPPDASLCLYRVTQEALHNVAQHAAARRAEVTLRRTAAGLELSIRDDGTGFDPIAGAKSGLGLISMDERVRLVRGAVQIVTGNQRGTELQVRVPLDAPRRVQLPAD